MEMSPEGIMVDRELERGRPREGVEEAEERLQEHSPSATTAAGPATEDVEFERALKIGREVMRDHRAVLAALAK